MSGELRDRGLVPVVPGKRTDQTASCAGCRWRFPDGMECPLCKGSELLDLRRDLDREVMLAGPSVRPSRVASHVVLAAFFVPMVAFFLVRGPAHAWFAIGAWIVLVFVAVRYQPVLAMRFPTIPRFGALENTASIRAWIGTIRSVDEPLDSPLHGIRCVAFRLIGHTRRAVVDDGGGVSFEVERDDGEIAIVELGQASVDLVIDREPAPVPSPDPRLVAFLVGRGTDGPDEPKGGRGYVLAERVLREGDRVVVEGDPETRTEHDGYRGSHEKLVFRDRPGARLNLRAAPVS